MKHAVLRRAAVAVGRVLCVAAYAAGLLYFRWYHPWQGKGVEDIALGFACFFAIIALGGVVFKVVPAFPSIPGDTHRTVLRTVALGLAVLFAINYLTDIEYNPLVIWGEWAISFTGAAELSHRMSCGVFAPSPKYNLGMGYLYLPLYALFGESITAAKALYLVCWSSAMLALAVVWKRERGWEGLFSILLVVATLAYGRAIERMYKWHVMAAYLSAALFVCSALVNRRYRALGFLLGTCALALALIGYHGCVVFLVVLGVYGAGSALLGPRGKRCGCWIMGASCVVTVALIVSISLGWVALPRGIAYFLQNRLVGELKGIYSPARVSSNLKTIARSFFHIFFVCTGPLASLALVSGISSSLLDFKKAWDARFITVGFWLLWLATMVVYPFHNLDEANYLVIFIILAMAYGVNAWLVRIGNPTLRICAVVVLAACLAWQEGAIYSAFYRNNPCVGIHPRNQDTQGLVALYDLKQFESPESCTVFFPAAGIHRSEGGLGCGVQIAVLKTLEYRAWEGRIRYYHSMSSLRRMVRSALAVRRDPRERVVAYASSAIDPRLCETQLVGLRYLLSEIVYFEGEWGVKVPAYKFTFVGTDPLVAEKVLPGEEFMADDDEPSFAMLHGTWIRIIEGGGIGRTVHAANREKGAAEARWAVEIPAGGAYEVFVRWTSAWNRAVSAPFTVHHSEGSTTRRMDQRQGGSAWVSLGKYRFCGDEPVTVSVNTDTEGWVIADAVKLVALAEDLPPSRPTGSYDAAGSTGCGGSDEEGGESDSDRDETP